MPDHGSLWCYRGADRPQRPATRRLRLGAAHGHGDQRGRADRGGGHAAGTAGRARLPAHPARRADRRLTLLGDGSVLLVAAGIATALRYDPPRGAWRQTGARSVDPRATPQTALLPDGTVLLLTADAMAEVYDPA